MPAELVRSKRQSLFLLLNFAVFFGSLIHCVRCNIDNGAKMKMLHQKDVRERIVQEEIRIFVEIGRCS